MHRVLTAPLTMLFQLKSIFELLLVACCVVINLLALGTLEFDQIVL